MAPAPSRPVGPFDNSNNIEMFPSIALRGIPDIVFDRFRHFPQGNIGTLQKPQSASAIHQWLCNSGVEVKSTHWKAEQGSENLLKLPMTQYRIGIRDIMSAVDVTILVAPTGTGKTLMGPMMLCEIFDGNCKKGITIVPGSDHGKEAAKQAEKMYMISREAHCEILNFINPFEREKCLFQGNVDKLGVINPSRHAYTTYRGALIALENGSDIQLSLMHIDEVHSTKPQLINLLARARELLKSKNVSKLLLTSATLAPNEIEGLRRYFVAEGLTINLIDLYREMKTNKRLTMSCAMQDASVDYGRHFPFVETRLSKVLTWDFLSGHVHRKNDEQLEEFGSEEHESIPEMNNMMPYVRQALDRSLDEVSTQLEARMRIDPEDNEMPSLLVVLPGKEHVDRMRSCLMRTLDPDEEKSAEEKRWFPSFKYEGQSAFNLIKLKPSSLKSRRHRSEEEEQSFPIGLELTGKDHNLAMGEVHRERKKQMRRELLIGPWGGRKGTINFAKPQSIEGKTLKDVVIIVDSGVHRVPGNYSRNGLRYMDLRWIDKRELFQRAGRCGRTVDGEYFLVVSAEKAKSILQEDNKSDLLRRNYDEQSFIQSKQLKVFDKLIWQPPEYLTNNFKLSLEVRGFWKDDKFTLEANLLHQYFPFLLPEHACFVVQCVRLGLAAHGICYVAESIATNKLCSRPTKTRENSEAIGEDRAHETYVNVLAQSYFKDENIRPYDMGDSVAKADMVVTWCRHTFPVEHSEDDPDFEGYGGYTEKEWKEMEEQAFKCPDGIFWAGRWVSGKESKENDKRDEHLGMKKLQEMFIREDGRETVAALIHQITRACQRLDLIPTPTYLDEGFNYRDKKGTQPTFVSLLSPHCNRYLIAENNFNLNRDGRDLFRALLTMNSDKMAKVGTTGYTFEIDVDACISEHCYMLVCPERTDWRHRISEDIVQSQQGKKIFKSTTKYVRYWSAFKATHSTAYTGCLDRLTSPQSVFFMNTLGKVDWEGDKIMIHLNGSPRGDKNGGLKFWMDEKVADRVRTVREALKHTTRRILMEKISSNEFSDFARAVIDLWRALDDGVEDAIEISDKWTDKNKTKYFDLVYGEGVPLNANLVNRYIPNIDDSYC